MGIASWGGGGGRLSRVPRQQPAGASRGGRSAAALARLATLHARAPPSSASRVDGFPLLLLWWRAGGGQGRLAFRFPCRCAIWTWLCSWSRLAPAPGDGGGGGVGPVASAFAQGGLAWPQPSPAVERSAISFTSGRRVASLVVYSLTPRPVRSATTMILVRLRGLDCTALN
jgi:hypothetical protein